jgi:AMIN domain
MNRFRVHLGCFLVTVSCVMAQTTPPASVRSVQVVNAGADVRIEITLSSPVKPSVVVATNPDRLVLELPNTLSDGKQKRISSHSPRVRGVRIGLHQPTPPMTHLVVDLDGSVPYKLHSDGSKITLVLTPEPDAHAETQHAAPARAVSGGLIGIFRSGGAKPTSGSSSSEDTGQILVPPASGPPIPFPDENQGDTTAKNSNPTVPPSLTPPSAATKTATAGSTFPEATPTVAETKPVAEAPKPEASTVAEAQVAEQKAPSASAAEPAAQPTPTSLTTDQTLLALQAADPSLRTVFRVKYVADGMVYLDGGSSSGLGEGMKLEIRDSDLPVQQGATVDPTDPRVVAELEVTGVADTSAAADIHAPKRPVKVGDLAYLSPADAQALIQQRTLSATRKFPAVVSFTDDETMDEEAHEEAPRPPQPSVNRARGMFGFDFMGTVSPGATSIRSTNIGFVSRVDITRMGGTFWNIRGYWRARINSEAVTGQPTLQDLINRTYHLNMTYENPNSRLVAGFGRLYLPWAPSLDTIDGGYFGFRPSKHSTVGVYGGSTPDPSSFSYNPDGKIAGAFVNFEGGSYEDFHYTSTSGAGINAVKWQITRPLVFFENSLSYKRVFSIYDSLQADSPKGNPAVPAPGAGLSRNFLTVRIAPHPRFEFDVNHTYFRDIPTFDPQLLGTGLLDKFLFQGFSVGGRVEVFKQVWLYTDIGQSSRTGDAKTSLNQSFGITVNHVPWLGIHADGHYSQFNSSFGTGSYRAISVSRNFREALHLQVLAGDESFHSSLTNNTRSRFINGTAETSFGARYFLQGGFTVDRGSMNYNQWMFTLGYRFDTRMKHQ